LASFTAAWNAGDPAAVALLPRGYPDGAERRRAVATASRREVHPAVLEALSVTTDAQRTHRDALARPGAAVVVTGQQAGLFGGPLYTVYKAAAAIADARALARETGGPCVPVFWLQNEDHDHEEIASARVLGSDGALHTVAVPGRPEDERRSIGARRLGPGVDAALDQVAALLGGLSEADAALGLLRRCYTADASPDGAFRAWVDALFAPHGLLVLDPRHPALVEAARPLHQRAIRDAGPHADALSERVRALRDAGYDAQVHVRPGAPLPFVHPDGLDGPRYRLEPDGEGGYRLAGVDGRLSAEAVARSAFSTSALLRPILQDTLLPTAAYVGGPGEIAYFAQLPPLYEAYGLPMPLIVPRARFRVVDEGAARLLDQLGLAAEALDQRRDALLASVVRPPEGGVSPEALEAAVMAPVRDALAGFAAWAEALDPALARAAEKTGATVGDAVGRLADRYRKALARADQVAVDRLDRLLARLQPEGAPQERVHAWPWFGARYGVEDLVGAVLEATAPFDGALKELRP
jgi:bacillithiol synthase